MHPKQCDGLVIFLRFASDCGESPERMAHFSGSLQHRGGFSQIHPCYLQVRNMMEILVDDLASLERAR